MAVYLPGLQAGRQMSGILFTCTFGASFWYFRRMR